MARGDKPIQVSRIASNSRQSKRKQSNSKYAISKHVLQWDMQSDKQPQINNVQTLFHCAPIWLLSKHIAYLASVGINRIIAFSSTSVFSKQVSENRHEQQLVSLLINAENELPKLCKKHHINLTILRPTLIYGYGRDQNITRIASFIRRFRFALLVGQAGGLRQPVHADDLVDAALKAKNATVTYGKVYNLSGQETMTYRAMVQRIFVALGIKQRIISCPLWLLRMVLTIAAKCSSFGYTADMANRMNQNLCYDASTAVNDFAYSPQPFLQNPQRDLGNRFA